MSVPDQMSAPRCYAHPDRVAGSVCRRCGRPICPDCMREAPVGWQCSSCVRQGARQSPVVRWRPAQGTGRLGSTRITPMVIALIVVNVGMYLYEQGHPAFEAKYELVPFYVHYGHRWYELITSAFLHANSTHILLNMVSLAIIGPPVEAALGKARFLLTYFLAAVGGSVAYYLIAPINQPGLGASGAIFGLMGSYFVIAKLRGWPVQQITVLLVINVLYSFSGGIAWQAHLGGLVTGAITTFGLMWSPRSAIRPSETAQVVQGVAVTIAGAAVLGLLAQLTPGHVNW